MRKSSESSVSTLKMMEEGQNHPTIFSPKQRKSQEIVENGEEDQISGLPDCLLLEILSRLPSTTEAIRTGTLSKRWKHLWTLVPTLIFYHDDDKHSWSDFVSFVDKTLTQCRQLKLKKFVLYTRCDIQCGSQVHNWIHYATRCNVEELNLKLWSLWSVENEFSLDESFFINTCLIDLTLSCCIFNPIGSINWKHLRSLCITHATLDEVLIENLISGSPLLETLVLDYCLGYRRLDITSKSIKNLVLSNCYGYRSLDNIEIKAPNILSLTIKGRLILGKLLLVNMSSLVEASLDYLKIWHYETTLKEVEEEMLRGFISNLRHVKELKIGVKCLEVLSRLEDKGFISPSNIKFPDVFVNDWSLAMLNNGPKGDEVN